MNKCKYKINIKDIQDRYKFKVFMRSGADIPKLITDDISNLNKKIKDLEEKVNKIFEKKYKYIEAPVTSELIGTGYIDDVYNVNEDVSYIFRHKIKCMQGYKISLKTNTNLNFFAIVYYDKNNNVIYGQKSNSTTEIQNFVAPENTDYTIIVSYFKENFVQYSSLKIMKKVQIIEGE